MSSVLVTLNDGQNLTGEALLEPWKKRVKQGLAARKPFETQWLENMAAAAGQQWLRVLERGGRQLVDIRAELEQQGRSHQEADVLTQYLWTALGILYAGDFRPELLAYHDDEEGDLYTKGLNKTFGWGWDEEWRGDTALFDTLLTIGTLGTGAIQPRYDRTRGAFLGQVPHAGPSGHTYTDANGEERRVKAHQPILDKTAARAYVADRNGYGEDPGLRPLREGAITWPVLSCWNLIPPPAIENSDDFPHEIIVRPAALDLLDDVYGERAQGVEEESLDAMNVLGLRDLAPAADGTIGSGAKLEGQALLYTGYERPCGKYPQGLTVVWAGDNVLHVEQGLPFKKGPLGPRSGITYFRYWKVKGRFWGRALIEPGIGPWRTRNKRLSQQDEIIDRGGPKVYANEGEIVDPTGHMMELIALKPGSQPPKIDPGVGPGQWMKDSIEQCDTDIQQGFGLHDTSLGETSPAGTPYAAIVQQTANDQVKLGPIVGPFQLGVADLSMNTIETMGNWPDGKRLMIEGEGDRLESIVFKRSMIPPQYMVRREKGGGLPKSSGAELQKISDLWTAAETCQLTAQDPLTWWEWYRASLDAGEAQPTPELNAKSQQQHKAALENVIMARLGQPVPVAPFDDATIHIPIHDQQEALLQEAMDEGDPDAARGFQAIEQHKQMHLAMAAQNAPPGAGQLPPGPPAATPGPPGAAPPAPSPMPPPAGPSAGPPTPGGQ